MKQTLEEQVNRIKQMNRVICEQHMGEIPHELQKKIKIWISEIESNMDREDQNSNNISDDMLKIHPEISEFGIDYKTLRHFIYTVRKHWREMEREEDGYYQSRAYQISRPSDPVQSRFNEFGEFMGEY
jgi:uncharacterized protein (UPF0335 family)